MPQKIGNQNAKDPHFLHTYGYVVLVTVLIMGYVLGVTFLPIPTNNTRFIDVAFGFLLKFLGDLGTYLIGNSTGMMKRADSTAVITAETTLRSDIAPISLRRKTKEQSAEEDENTDNPK